VKTDSIFYRLFQELPEIFFELIGNPPQTAEGYKFSSIEIKQTTFRIDGVFLPTKGKKILFILLKSSFKPTQKFIRA
jgi:predicted transposase/invertase (TIGR01784 family)